MNKKILLILTIIIITAAGFTLRLFQIGADSLWFDEIATLETSRYDIDLIKNDFDLYSFTLIKLENPPDTLFRQIKQILNNTENDRIHLPLYYIIIYFVKLLFGDSEFLLRLPSALFGTGAILMMYPLARQFCKKEEAILSTVLMAFMWFPVHYSREARMYTLLLFFVMISIYYSIRFFKKLKANKISYQLLICFLLASAVCMYTHFFGFYFVILQVIYYFVYYIIIKNKISVNKNQLYVSLATTIIILLIISIPIFLKVLNILKESNTITNIIWMQSPAIDEYPQFLYAFFNYPIFDVKRGSNIVPGTIKSAVVPGIILISVFLFILKTISIISRENKNKVSLQIIFQWIIKSVSVNNGGLLFLWLFIPPALIFIISQFTPMYHTRYFIFCLPPAYILLAKLFLNIINKKIISYLFISCFILLLLYDLIVIKDIYTGINTMQIKEAIEYIQKEEKNYPGYFIGSNLGSFGIEYYAKKNNLLNTDIYFIKDFNRSHIKDEYIDQKIEEEKKEIQKIIKQNNYKYLWYVKYAEVENTISDNLQIISSKEFFVIDVILYSLHD